MTEPTNPPRRDMADDEISLVELTLVLMRHKVWAIGVFVVIVLGGMAKVVLTPHPGYEGQARVAMVDVPEGEWSVIPGLVSEGDDGALEENRQRVRDAMEALATDASADVSIERSGDWLELEAHAADADAIRSFLETVEREASAFIESHWLPDARSVAEAYQARLDGLSRRAERLNRMASDAETGEALARYTEAEVVVLGRLEKEASHADDALNSLIKAWRDDELREADIEIGMVSEISNDNRSALILALAVVLGVMAGLFAAFFAEFIDNVRRQATISLKDSCS